ncbi:MAG: ABC transporter substrate-binding protein [Comamonas sp.]|nr:ABC transporter substrate-binding protein [Candidatus Comamonas equi]
MAVAAAFCWAILQSTAWAQSVVFINPGKSDEAFWVAASDGMQKAAHSLGMELTVVYAERDRLEPIEIAKRLAAQPVAKRPRYVIFTNDYSVAPGILRALAGSGIEALMAFSGIQDALRTQVGKPRDRYTFWLGSLEPKAQEAGYLTAKALIDKARAHRLARGPQTGRLHMVAIAGDRSTPSSIARNEGMRKAVQEAGDVILEQEVYGEWRRDKAQEQALVLFQRYPQARLVWAGSDQMALGAINAWEQRGGKAGVDAFFSGVNTSVEAFSALEQGQLSALAGGHFLAGAWAMVMLFDHAKGIDFIGDGVELQQNMFTLFDAASVERFTQRFTLNAQPLDFKPFSKFYTPGLKRYDFDLAKLLR